MHHTNRELVNCLEEIQMTHDIKVNDIFRKSVCHTYAGSLNPGDTGYSELTHQDYIVLNVSPKFVTVQYENDPPMRRKINHCEADNKFYISLEDYSTYMGTLVR